MNNRSYNFHEPQRSQNSSGGSSIAQKFEKLCTSFVLLILFVVVLISLTLFISSADTLNDVTVQSIDVVENFNTGMNNLSSTALDGIYTVNKVYKIPDGSISAPKPNKDNFGNTTDKLVIENLIASASDLLGDDSMVWNSDTKVYRNTPIEYYYDETILVIAWKEVIGTSVFNFAEVKIAHPSQFRKLFSENTYGSNTKYKGSQMGKSANAVLTSNADYYGYRKIGIVVYNGVLYRTTGKDLDTCFIDSNGDLLMVPANTFKTDDDIRNYIQEHDVVFSLAFGPIIIKNGIPLTDSDYFLGEPTSDRVRAAISQIDSLHYLVTVVDCATKDGTYYSTDILHFANNLATKKIDNAYTLDGGQTAMLMIEDRIISNVLTGSERQVTDIIYFGTALPDGSED